MSQTIATFIPYIFCLTYLLFINNYCYSQRSVKPILRLEDNYALNNENVFSYEPYQTSYEPYYLMVASSQVRPGQVYRIAVNLLYSPFPLSLIVSVKRNDEEIAGATETILPGDSQLMLMQIPLTARTGNYHLKVEGNGENGGNKFVANATLTFRPQFLTILIQTNQLVYNMKQSINIRVILLNTETKPYVDAINIYLYDSRGLIMKRWNSIYPFQGLVSVQFGLPSDYPIGWWRVRVEALEQIEEKSILLERWFTDRFDVTVQLPAFVANDQQHIEGTIIANHTNLLPVSGNATIRVILLPPNTYMDWKQLNGDYSNYSYYNDEPLFDNTIKTEIISRFEGQHTFRYSLSELESYSVPLLGRELVVYVAVGEKFFDHIVVGYARIRVIDSSIVLRFLDSDPTVFKPGMPFECHVSVSHSHSLPLSADIISESRLQITPSFGLDRDALFNGIDDEIRLTDSNSLSLKFDANGVAKVKLKIPAKLQRFTLRARLVSGLYEAGALLTAIAVYSPSDRILEVTTSTETGEPGQYAIFHVYANFYMKYFYYVLMSKGYILMSGQQSVTGMLRSITTFSIALSTEMAPSCALIVYHVTPDGEVIADSVTLPVKGINRAKLTLGLNLNQDRSGNLIEFVPSLTTASFIGHSVFDNDYQDIQAFNDITSAKAEFAFRKFQTRRSKKTILKSRDGKQEKVFYYKTHNTARDSSSTFAFDGLIVFTNLNMSGNSNKCNKFFPYYNQTFENRFATNGRPSQAQQITTHLLLPCLTSDHCYEVHQRCDGYRHCFDGTDEMDCEERRDESLELNDFFVYRRNRNNYFYSATGDNFGWNNTFTSYNVDNYVATNVPQRPVLWLINAIGVSQSFGLSILEEPIYHSSVRPFFITVEAPTTAVIGEQIGIKVAAFNYQSVEIEADIILEDSADYRFVHVGPMGRVSSYAPKTSAGIHQHLIYLLPQSTLLVPIPMVATKIGVIKIVITGRCQAAKDTKEIEMEILADGAQVNLHTSLMLDLRAQAYIIKFLDINITEDPIIPYEDNVRRYIFGSPKASVSLIGDVVGTPSRLQPIIDFTSLGIKGTAKCGELRMFNFAYHLYTLKYLRLTNQLGTSAQHKLEKDILQELSRDYVYQMRFFTNNSFTMFGREGSVWLSAYCARVYFDAQYDDWHNLIYIDPIVISQSLLFVLNHQILETGHLFGSFYEPFNNFSSPRYSSVALTAHVLITLVRVTDVYGSVGVKASNAKQSAINFLESQLPSLRSAYEVAITTYSLMIAGSVDAKFGFNLLENMKRITEGMVYWSDREIKLPGLVYQSQRPYIQPRVPQTYESLAIEGTSYALMAYIRYEGLVRDQIVRWLNYMRLHSFGFSSTIDTIVAIQALTDYSFRTHVRSVTNMRINIEGSSNPRSATPIDIASDNLAHHYSVDIGPNVWGHVMLTASGAGLAVVQLDTQYNVDHDFLLIQPQENAFDLSVEMSMSGRNKSRLAIRTCAKWLLTGLSQTSGVTVIELTIPTGYWQNKAVIDRYLQTRIVPRLAEAKVMPRSATFIFDYLDSDWSCVKYSVDRWFPVANLTRWLKARVYDLYQPEFFKEKIVDDYSLYALHICEVCGSYQCPYCPYFSFANPIRSHNYFILFIFVLKIFISLIKLN